MTLLHDHQYPAGGISLDERYAVLSPDVRRTRAELRPPTPGTSSQVERVLRIVELRERPFATAVRTIESFGALAEDWDSYGAEPITQAAVLTARSLLNDLSYRPSAYVSPSLTPFAVSPIPTGGVHIEWSRQDGAALEIWIAPSGTIRALVDRPTSEPRFVTKDVTSLAEAVSEVESFAA